MAEILRMLRKALADRLSLAGTREALSIGAAGDCPAFAAWHHSETKLVGRVSMPSVHIRALSGSTLEKLRARARRNGRSLQAELKLILEEASGRDWSDTLARAERMRRRLARRVHDDSTELIARDRQSR
jgi:plasmid stability protein